MNALFHADLWSPDEQRWYAEIVRRATGATVKTTRKRRTREQAIADAEQAIEQLANVPLQEAA